MSVQRGSAVNAVVAIAALLVIASIVVPYAKDWLETQGSNSTSASSGALSPTEVRQHPERYIGENITVEGWYDAVFGILPKDPSTITEADAMEISTGSLMVSLSENVQVFISSKYRFNGVLTSIEILGSSIPQLQVSSVEPV